jgi:hypothetical protein
MPTLAPTPAVRKLFVRDHAGADRSERQWAAPRTVARDGAAARDACGRTGRRGVQGDRDRAAICNNTVTPEWAPPAVEMAER